MKKNFNKNHNNGLRNTSIIKDATSLNMIDQLSDYPAYGADSQHNNNTVNFTKHQAHNSQSSTYDSGSDNKSEDSAIHEQQKDLYKKI